MSIEKKIEKECRWCAKTFTPEFEDQPEFCSAACYEAYNEARQEVNGKD